MADAHQVVIDNIGQVVGGQLVVAFVEHLVIEDIGLDVDVATDHIVDHDHLARLHEETDDILLAVVDELLDLLGRTRERVAHRQSRVGVILEVLHLSTLLLQFLGRIEGIVGLALVEELLHILLIDLPALALTVRAVASTEADTLVKVDTQPAERLREYTLPLPVRSGWSLCPQCGTPAIHDAGGQTNS